MSIWIQSQPLQPGPTRPLRPIPTETPHPPAALAPRGAGMAGGGDGAPGAGDGGRPQRKRSGLVITDEKLLWELQNEAMGNDSWRRPAAAPPKPKPKSSAAPAQPAPAAKRPAPTAAAPASKNGSNGKMTVAAAPAFRLQPAAASSQRPPAAEAAAANGGAKRLKATLVDSYIDWRDYGGRWVLAAGCWAATSGLVVARSAGRRCVA